MNKMLNPRKISIVGRRFTEFLPPNIFPKSFSTPILHIKRWISKDEDEHGEKYEDIPGFCKAAKTEEIASHGYVLTPGRYVRAAEVEDDGEPFEEKMRRLTGQLNQQFAESAKLEQAIRTNLSNLRFEDIKK